MAGTINLKSYVTAGSPDENAALASFLADASATAPEVEAIVDSGVYRLTTSHELLNTYGTLRGRGKAVLKYEGGPITNVLRLSDPVYNRYQQTVRDLTVQGNAGSDVLLYLNAVHHAIVENIDLRDAHPGGAAMRTSFCVLGKFRNIRCSWAEEFIISRPYYGLIVGGNSQSSADQTIASTFDGLIVEGMQGDGIALVNSWDNTFNGGTSEANEGWGICIHQYCRRNLFNTMFFEANARGDINVHGHENLFLNIEAMSPGPQGSVFIENGYWNRFIGGKIKSVNIGHGSTGTLLDSVIIDEINDNGTETVIRNCYTSTGARHPDKSAYLMAPSHYAVNRPTPAVAEHGRLIFNLTENRLQVWDGCAWQSLT